MNIETAESLTELNRDENSMREVMKALTERQRRTFARRVDRGEDEVDVINEIVGEISESDGDRPTRNNDFADKSNNNDISDQNQN